MRSSEEENQLSGSDIRFNPPLYIQRYQKAFDILNQNKDIVRIADFGCAEGKFVRRLKKLASVEMIVCVDIDDISLEYCQNEARPLAWDAIFGRSQPLTINVLKGSVAQKDSLLKGFDAITCIELIEHLPIDTISQLVENIFGFIRPKLVIITTPNSEFNVVFPQLNGTNKLRHWDHKFEWTRQQFTDWCHSVVKAYDFYSFEMTGVGEPPDGYIDIGFCTQIAVFRKNDIEFNNNNQLAEVDDKEYSNYRPIDTFYIRKSDRKEPTDENEEPIDWDSVLG